MVGEIKKDEYRMYVCKRVCKSEKRKQSDKETVECADNSSDGQNGVPGSVDTLDGQLSARVPDQVSYTIGEVVDERIGHQRLAAELHDLWQRAEGLNQQAGIDW